MLEAVDGGCDGANDLVCKVGVAGPLGKGRLVLVGDGVGDGGDLALLDVVGLNDGGKDGEAGLDIAAGLERVGVDANHLHLVAWPRTVDEVASQHHLLVAWHAARWH